MNSIIALLKPSHYTQNKIQTPEDSLHNLAPRYFTSIISCLSQPCSLHTSQLWSLHTTRHTSRSCYSLSSPCSFPTQNADILFSHSATSFGSLFKCHLLRMSSQLKQTHHHAQACTQLHPQPSTHIVFLKHYCINRMCSIKVNAYMGAGEGKKK